MARMDHTRMPDQSFLGLSSTAWQAIAALATAASTVTAICIAKRSNTPRAKLTVSFVMDGTLCAKSKNLQYVKFHIVNTGDRPLTITQLGWTAGPPFAKRVELHIFDDSISSELPVSLSHGEQATWWLAVKTQDRNWPIEFAQYFLSPHSWLMRKTLKAHAYTSTGHRFNTKPDQSFFRCISGRQRK